MGDRFPFQYFAKYYGIEYLAAFSGCSTAVEASTQTISKLINTVKEIAKATKKIKIVISTKG